MHYKPKVKALLCNDLCFLIDIIQATCSIHACYMHNAYVLQKKQHADWSYFPLKWHFFSNLNFFLQNQWKPPSGESILALFMSTKMYKITM